MAMSLPSEMAPPSSSDGPGGGAEPDEVSDGEVIVDPGDDEVTPAPAAECARDTYEGQRVDVNLYLLLDISGSMDAPISTDTTQTQWEAVRAALIGFLESEDTEGLRVALNYYPILGERSDCSIRNTCEQDVACLTTVCDLRLALLDVVTACGAASDCGLVAYDEQGNAYEEACVVPGRCSNSQFELCFLDDQCEGGVCEAPTAPGLCPGQNSCVVGEYATPAVARNPLPEGSAEMVESLLGHAPDPFGITPTHIALQGAYEHVASWIAEDPQTPSFVVLATDGAPLGCTAGLEQTDVQATEDTYAVIEAGLNEGLQTFVIGVLPDLSGLPPEDQAESLPIVEGFARTLDQMALLGGTEAPYNVTADVTTAESFKAALDEIRGQVLPCEYRIPEPESGVLSFDRLNVELTVGGQTQVIPKVENESECVADEKGWYYNVDATTQTPTRVVLCPQTCSELKTEAVTSVHIVLGCQTVIRVR
jgi:hypothetical protein